MDNTISISNQERQRHGFVFHGNAKEYFGIYIVNVLLTIVTLGIYSAWAKVRFHRYFHGSTELAGARFAYLATPMQILIGRIVVVAVLIVLNLVATFLPIIGSVLILALVLIFPELIRRSLRFQARTTAYRNVRFDFEGGFGRAFVVFLLAPLLTVLSLGLLTPFATRMTQDYIWGNLRYGGRPFQINAKTGQYYGVFWLPFLIFVLGIILISLISVAAINGLDQRSGDPELVTLALLSNFAPIYIIAFLVFGAASMIYAAGVRNVALNAMTLDQRHGILSNVKRLPYVWLMVTNFLVTVLTLTLMRPWAAVRHARFLANATAVDVSGSLETYTDAVAKSGGAIGAEYTDIEGIEFGL